MYIQKLKNNTQIQKIIGIIAALVIGIGPLLTIIGGLIKGFSLLVSAIGFIATPVGIAIAAIAGLTGALIYLYNTDDADGGCGGSGMFG